MNKRIYPALIIFLFFNSVCSAISPGLVPPDIRIYDNHLIVSTELKDWFTPELRETLHSTIPVKISLRVQIFREKTFWVDDKAVSESFTKRIVYDKKTKQFILEYQDGLPTAPKEMYFDSIDELLNHVSYFTVFLSLKDINIYSKRKCYIRMRVKMDDRHELFKIPGSFTTSWVKSRYFTIKELLDDV